MVYWSIVRDLDVEKRTELDGLLGTSEWSTFGSVREVVGPTTAGEPGIPDGAPAWWHGDVDASQSFITAMGVNLAG